MDEITEILKIINTPSNKPRSSSELKRALKFLKRLCLSKKKLDLSTNSRTRCVYCYEPFTNQNNTCQLPCQCLQTYHKNCFIENVFEQSCLLKKEEISFSCEICKNSIAKKDLENVLGKNDFVKLEEKFKSNFFECSICLEKKNVEVNCITLSCNHRFCDTCLQSHINVYVDESKLPIKCPECSEEIDYYIILYSLDLVRSAKYENLTLQRVCSVSVVNPFPSSREKAIKCPNAECKLIFVIDKEEKYYTSHTCERCKMRFCIGGCKQPHDGFTCENYRTWLRENDEADIRFEVLMKKEQWRKCPKCGIAVERIKDCPHMTCGICKMQFCYLCHDSARWGTCKHAT